MLISYIKELNENGRGLEENKNNASYFADD